MKIFKTSLILTLCVGVFTAFTADEKKDTTLRLNLPQGKTVKMTSTINMDYYSDQSLSNKLMSMKMAAENEYTVKEKTEEGLHAIDYTVTRIKLDQQMGMQTISYDSDNPDTENPMAGMIRQQLSGILNKPIHLKVNELGEIVKQPEKAATSTFDITQTTDQIFIKFPEEPVGTGDTWTSQDTVDAGNATVTSRIDYTVSEISKDRVTIKSKVTPTSFVVNGEEQEDMKMDQAGTMVFDKNTGQLLSVDMNQSLTITDPARGEIFMVSTTKVNAE